jgi:hypothetical protein
LQAVDVPFVTNVTRHTRLTKERISIIIIILGESKINRTEMIPQNE